jgi:hypothetical protein
LRLEPLRDFERNDTAVGVARDGIGAMRLCALDRRGVTADHLVHRREERLARLKTSSAERIEGAIVREVLGEVDENKNFADTGMDHENGCLAAGELEWNYRIILDRCADLKRSYKLRDLLHRCVK